MVPSLSFKLEQLNEALTSEHKKESAMAARLQDRGEIAVGLRADLTQFGLVGTYPRTRGVWVQGGRVA